MHYIVWSILFLMAVGYLLWRFRWILLIGLLLILIGCTTTGKGHYCDNLYLEPVCVKKRLAEEARIRKEKVKVCEVTGSRIKKKDEKCVLMDRDSVKRVLTDPRG